MKAKLTSMFKMGDRGEAKVCLGLEIFCDRKRNTMKISQTSYADIELLRPGMNVSKPDSTPMLCQGEENDFNNEKIDSSLNSQAIGSLMYLMVCTRSDCFICFEPAVAAYEQASSKTLDFCKDSLTVHPGNQ